MGKADEEKVTMTKAELAAIIDERVKSSNMPEGEKRLREVVGEVVDERLAAFMEVIGPDDDGDPGKDNKPKDKSDPPAPESKGLFETVAEWLSPAEPASSDA
jgi:hypothetical protein